MKLEFFDDDHVDHLFPLTLTRPAADLRCGILTVAQKWLRFIASTDHGFATRDYLNQKFKPIANPDLKINGRLLPSPNIIYAVKKLQPGQKLVFNGILLAERPGPGVEEIACPYPANLLKRPHDLFVFAGTEIERDYAIITANRSSVRPHNHNRTIGAHPIFLEDGAKVSHSVLNTENGPIYIGKNAHVMEGCLIQGPFAMGEGSTLKMGTKVYNKTALGPYTVIGGEVNNVQVQGYSNKGHDGFLGNAVIGEWCNIGADTNASNLKNNYEDVKLWNYASGKFDKSGHQFCGLIMGDHSKCGINTMFNTGTVVGVSANVFGSGFPRNFIPDFAWGGASGFITYKLDAAVKTASLVLPRRNKVFDEIEEGIMTKVFELTKEWRNWE